MEDNDYKILGFQGSIFWPNGMVMYRFVHVQHGTSIVLLSEGFAPKKS